MCPEAVTVFVWCSKLLHSSDFFVDVRFVKTTHTIFLCELKGVNITQTKEVHHNLSAIWEMKTFLEKIMWFPASVDSVKFVNWHSNIANHEIRRTCEILGRLTYFNWSNLEFWRFTFFSPSATLVLPIRGPQKRALLQSEAYFPARKTQCARPSLARKRNRLRRGDSSAALSGVSVKTAQQFREERCRQKMKIQGLCGTIFWCFCARNENDNKYCLSLATPLTRRPAQWLHCLRASVRFPESSGALNKMAARLPRLL